MKNKIQNFPVTSFSAVMGLTGLSIVLGKFYHLQLIPKIFYDVSLFFVLSVFLLFILMYSLKFVLFPEEVKGDFNHKIRTNFFSAISISLLLLSVAFYTYYPLLAIPIWWVGLILHTFLTFRTIRFWIENSFDIKQFNPAWFIPVVGNLLIPITGVDLLPSIVSYFYFAVGLFFWIILFSLFLYRTIFHDHLPEKFIPTFFILLAPPAIGFVSYIRLTASWDNFSLLLLLLSYFFLILLATMYKKFFGLRYYISWWAFTFPLTAVTVASLVALQITKYIEFLIISWLMLGVTLIAILIVSAHTIKNIVSGEICVKEE